MVIIRRTNTKERILKESLRLFSTLGYHAVGVEMIAAAVKVTPPSLYKHFKGKQEILDDIIAQSDKNYQEHIFHFDTFTTEELRDFDFEKFCEATMEHVDNVLHDEVVKSVRKLCMIEQFRNEELRLMHINNTYVESEATAKNFLSSLMKAKGIEVPPNIDHLARVFVAPLISTVDRCYCDPDFEKEGIEYIKSHVKYIWNNYFKDK